MQALATLLLRLASHDAGLMARQAKRNAALIAAAALFGGTAFVAFVAAIAILLAESLGPFGAAMTIAVAMLALSLGAIAAVLILNRRDRRRRALKLGGESGQAIAIAVAAGLAPTLLRSKGLIALAVTAAVAYGLLKRQPGAPAVERDSAP